MAVEGFFILSFAIETVDGSKECKMAAMRCGEKEETKLKGTQPAEYFVNILTASVTRRDIIVVSYAP